MGSGKAPQQEICGVVEICAIDYFNDRGSTTACATRFIDPQVSDLQWKVGGIAAPSNQGAQAARPDQSLGAYATPSF